MDWGILNEELNLQAVDHVFELIGNTPTKRLGTMTKTIEADVFVKLEYLNPSGSLKDRIALQMIEDAEKKGTLKKGDIIVEASTGNTGIAFSFVGINDWEKYINIDPSLFRPTEIDVLIGDSTRAHNELGWYPEHTFNDLVYSMVYHDCLRKGVADIVKKQDKTVI